MHLITKFHLTAYKFFLFKIYFPSLNILNVKTIVGVHEKFCQVWSLSLHPPSWANCNSLTPQPELSQDSEIQVFSKCGHFPYPRPDPDCISPVSPAKISRHDPWLTVRGCHLPCPRDVVRGELVPFKNDFPFCPDLELFEHKFGDKLP